MPDISDVGPPAKGPGLPERIAEAKPPPVKVRIEHGWVWSTLVCILVNAKYAIQQPILQTRLQRTGGLESCYSEGDT